MHPHAIVVESIKSTPNLGAAKIGPDMLPGRLLSFMVCTLLLFLLSSASWAHSGGSDNHLTIKRDWSSMPTVEVIGNSESYVSMKGGGVTFQMHYDIHLAHRNGRIRSFRAWPVVMTTPAVSLDAVAESRYYDSGDRQNSLSGNIDIDIPRNVMNTYAVDVCNRHADALRAAGRSNTEIFGKTNRVLLRVEPRLTAEYRKGSSGNVIAEGLHHYHDKFSGVEVKCLKWEGLTIPNASSDLSDQPPIVRSITLEVTDITDFRGTCKIRLRGLIRTNRPNVRVRFRFKHYEQSSGIMSVTTNSQSWAYYDHTVNVPYNEEGVETGQVQTIAESPAGESPTESYWMECVKPAATGYATELPPELKIDLVPEEMALIKGQVCPTRVKAIGLVKANGSLEGTAFLPVHIEDGVALVLGTEIDAENGDHRFVVRNAELVWQRSGPQMTVSGGSAQTAPRFKMITAELYISTDAGQRTYETGTRLFKVECKIPRLNPDIGGPTDEKADLPNGTGDEPAGSDKKTLLQLAKTKQKKRTGSLTTGKSVKQSLTIAKAKAGQRARIKGLDQVNLASNKKGKKKTSKEKSVAKTGLKGLRKAAANAKVDFAVVNLTLSNSGKKATVRGAIRNKSRATSKVAYRVVVKSRNGKLLLKKDVTATVAPGKNANIQIGFSRKKARHLHATLRVLNSNDTNAANNKRNARLSVGKKSGKAKKKAKSKQSAKQTS